MLCCLHGIIKSVIILQESIVQGATKGLVIKNNIEVGLYSNCPYSHDGLFSHRVSLLSLKNTQIFALDFRFNGIWKIK